MTKRLPILLLISFGFFIVSITSMQTYAADLHPDIANAPGDCTPYATAWNANQSYLMTGSTSAERYNELVDAIECANDYGGAYSPDVVINDDIVLIDSIVTTIFGGNAFPEITSNLTIHGNDKAILRMPYSQKQYRFFHIQENGNLTINNFALIGGDSWGYAGAIFNSAGSLTMMNSVVANNQVSSSGGALYNDLGTMRIVNSEIFSNSTYAFINNEGNLIVVSSYINNNNGAVASTRGKFQLINSVVSGNINNYIVYIRGGEAKIINSSVVDNVLSGFSSLRVLTYGDPDEFSLDIVNTIIAGSVQGNDISIYYRAVPNVSVSGLSIVGDGSYQSANILNVDPMLSYNLVPELGSPAINAGNLAGLPADEFDLDNDGDTTEVIPIDIAGNSRVQDGAVDIGALESSFSAPTPTPAPPTPAPPTIIPTRIPSRTPHNTSIPSLTPTSTPVDYISPTPSPTQTRPFASLTPTPGIPLEDCQVFLQVWDADQVYVLSATDNWDRYEELVEAMICASLYSSEAVEVRKIRLNGDIELGDELYNRTSYRFSSTAFPTVDTLLHIDGNGYKIERLPSSSRGYRFLRVSWNGDLTIENLSLVNGTGGGVDPVVLFQ